MRRRRFGVLCVLGYVTLSWAVRLDLRHGEQIASFLYPLDTFSMYARMPPHEMSHVMVRDAGGDVHRVTAFRAFDCDFPEASARRCAERQGIAYLDEKLMRYVRGHAGTGDEGADLIYRTWRLRLARPPVQIPDCVIAHCRVSR